LLQPDWQWTSQRSGDALVKQATSFTFISPPPRKALPPRHTRTGLRRPGLVDGRRQHQRRRAGYGRGRDLRSPSSIVRPGGEANRLQLQALCLHSAIEDGVKPETPSSMGRCASATTRAQLRERLQRAHDHSQRLRRVAKYSCTQAGRACCIHKVIDMAHRFASRRTSRYLPVALVQLRFLSRTGRFLFRLPQRWHPDHAAPYPQGLQRRWNHALGRSPEVNQVIDQQTARTMMMLLQAVTATRHRCGGCADEPSAGRQDRHTSDFTDAWFLGFSPRYMRSLGRLRQPPISWRKETGARAALPIWMTFMKSCHRRQARRAVPGNGPDSQMLNAAAAFLQSRELTTCSGDHRSSAEAATATRTNASPSLAEMKFAGRQSGVKVVVDIPEDKKQARPALTSESYP